MYPNHIPHNHLPLEDLLNVKVQRGLSRNPQRAGIQWAGHDAKPETIIRILDASYSFILTWTDLFKIGTPRDLGLTDLLSECFDPGKQYSYYMDFADPNSVIITEKGSINALMVNLDGSIVHAPDMRKIINDFHVIDDYEMTYAPFKKAGAVDGRANAAIFVSPDALSVSHLRAILTEDASVMGLLISQIRDYHELQLGYDDTSAWLSHSGKRPHTRTNPTGLYINKARSSVLLTIGPNGEGECPAYTGEHARPTRWAESILNYGLERAINGQYGNRYPR